MHFCASSVPSTHLASCKLGISTTHWKDKNRAPKSSGRKCYWSAFWLLTSNGNCMKQGSEMSWTFFSICWANPFGPICSELLVPFCWSEPSQHHLVRFPLSWSALHSLFFGLSLREETEDGWLKYQHRQLRYLRKYVLSGALESGSMKFICTVIQINMSNPRVNKL